MHEQAQLRLKKDEVIRLGAEVYVIQSHDLVRTRVFKEENRLLSLFAGPFSKEKSLVFSTALSDPSGRAAAIYGVARKCVRCSLGELGREPLLLVRDRSQGNPHLCGASLVCHADILCQGSG